jgi:hypothetical protein
MYPHGTVRAGFEPEEKFAHLAIEAGREQQTQQDKAA